MAKYKIEGAPKGKAYVNISDDGPRLVSDGATVTVADDVVPGDWMKPLDTAAKAAVARREQARSAAKSGEAARLRRRLAELESGETKTAA